MPIDHLNFRLRGIPCEYQSRTDVRELVRSLLSIEPGASFAIHSLAISPVEHDTKVATLSFRTIPDILSDGSKNEWVFSLPSDDTLDGFSPRKPLVFDTHFSGFTPLQHTKDDDCDVDVIAISGLNGHAFGSFKERHGPFMWLRDALPLDVSHARLLIYGYDTQLIQSNSFQNLTDLGRALQIDMKGIWKSSQARPIIFIGHSLGGLVIKEAVIKLKEEVDDEDVSILNSLIGFLFFGVPHLGMAIESLVPLVRDFPNRGLLESLNKNSALLHRLVKEFDHAFGVNFPRIVAFYETETSATAEEDNGKWTLSGPPKVLVDVSSATCGSKHQHPVNRNHSDMVKFRHQYDEFYMRVKIALQPLVSRRLNPVLAVTGCRPSKSGHISEQQRECLQSLAFREQESRYHGIHSAKDACDWLFEDRRYQFWISQPRGLFWIKGNPGTGKSVLMKFAVTMMNRKKSSELISFFFCHGRGMLLQKTPLGVYRALLNSMLASFPEHLAHLTAKFEDRERRFGSYEMSRWGWTKNELQDFMSEVLIKGTKNLPVTIFVDALDECGKEDAKDLLQYFNKLMEDVEREEAQVKICFSSRHYPILGFHKIPTVFVEEQNGKDIRQFIQERLKDIEPETKRQQIETEILLKAQGGFQWVVLVTDMVTNGNTIGVKADELYKHLTKAPETLDELYATILNGATETENQQMIKLFQWVLFTGRPLCAQELREALAADKDMICLTVSELRSHVSWGNTLGDFETYIKHISRGLVEFQTREVWEQHEPDGENWDREVQFIHQSVADYVLEKFLAHIWHRQFAPHSQIGAGHFQISRTCLRYLTLKEVLQGGQLPRGTLSARFPLAPYAVQFLFHHVQKVEQEGMPQLDLLQLFQWKRKGEFVDKIARLWRVLDPNYAHAPMGWPFVNATPLHALVALGSKSAFDGYLEKDDAQVDGRDVYGNTPLLLAIRECHQDMALALLERSSKWQAQHDGVDHALNQCEYKRQKKSHLVDIDAENENGDTPLTIALAEHAEEVILNLINAGIDLKTSGREALLVSYAIRHRNKLILMKLIEKEVNLSGAIYLALKVLSDEDSDYALEELVSELLNAGGNTRCSKFGDDLCDHYMDIDDQGGNEDVDDDDEAILLASRKGQISVVNLLLSQGASATYQNKYGRFPLLAAVKNGHEELARVLLQRAPSTVEMKDYYSRTALHVALTYSTTGMVMRLLEKYTNLDVDSQDAFGHTPLSLAAKAGHEDAVQLLLERGAKTESTDISGNTPLLLAAVNGHEAATRLLLQGGANMESMNKSSKTPLLLAAGKGHEAITRLLLQRGANIDYRGYYGQTPLLLAAENGHEATTRLLLQGGASTESMNNFGTTPLFLAAQNGHDAITQLLLERGADIEVKNSSGYTPLSQAVKARCRGSVQLLLERGANFESLDKYNRTPLLLAIEMGDEAIVKLLLENGAEIECKDGTYGQTPLFMATRRGDGAIVKLLLEKGADVGSKDRNGQTALSWAVEHEHKPVLELLRAAAQEGFIERADGVDPCSCQCDSPGFI